MTDEMVSKGRLAEEKTKSFEHGKACQMKTIAEELNEESGRLYADDRFEEARRRKKLAQQFEEDAERMMDAWREEHGSEGSA